MNEDFSIVKNKTFTTNYKYNAFEQEFVFCCKGKPFATLVSSNLPTPTSNLVDYDLVKDLNLKMTDLQCQKYHFAGNRFRILGKVSTTVQCVEEGALSGVNFHIKGLVVSDLNKILDTHCVAGGRMKKFLVPDATYVSPLVPDASHVSQEVPDASHVSQEVPDASHVSQEVPDASHVSQEVPDASHVSQEVPDAIHVPPKVPDAIHMPPKVPDAFHVPPKVLGACNVSPHVPDHSGTLSADAHHVSSQVSSHSHGGKQRHTTCVQCHNPLGDTIDKDFVRCTICHEKLLMMLAKMPHKWFQPAFRDEMASVRGIQCRAEDSDLEIGFSDSDNSSHCSEESPFRRNWGKEPWKRNWEERLKRKRRK